MEFKKFTLLGKDGRYRSRNDWSRKEDMKINCLFNTKEEALSVISWAKEYAKNRGIMQEYAKEILDNKPVIEEVIVSMKFVNHDKTQVAINGGWI